MPPGCQGQWHVYPNANGYVSGPQFIASLNRKTISQLHLALISTIAISAFIFIAAKVMDLDKGTAAG
jgi:putative transport protein